MHKKRIYRKPTIETIVVDHTVSFMMSSLPPGDPTDSDPFETQELSSDTPQLFDNSVSEGNNPFGGTHPNYNIN